MQLDPHEKGLRKALNLGHTIGHAIESFAMEQGRPMLHGYAVAYRSEEQTSELQSLMRISYAVFCQWCLDEDACILFLVCLLYTSRCV